MEVEMNERGQEENQVNVENYENIVDVQDMSDEKLPEDVPMETEILPGKNKKDWWDLLLKNEKNGNAPILPLWRIYWIFLMLG